MVIPIEYSPRDSFLARLRGDPTLASKASDVWPRLAYEMIGMRYDGTRRLNSLNQRVRPALNGDYLSPRRFFVGTPYIFTFSLYATTRAIDDMNQIVEQILPIFNPDYTLLLNLLPTVGVRDRMRIVMDGAPQITDSSEMDGFTKQRTILGTFTFNVSATLYGPIASTPPTLIRQVLIDLYDATRDSTLTGPIYMLSEALDHLVLEDDSGYLLDESTVSDIHALSRVARISAVPDPITAAPQRPVAVTTTITEYDDGKVANVFTNTDDDIDVGVPE